ncbi:MAG: mechanosensitive ion channel family protein [Candidatus Margulisiibacteriota bacterium]
MDHIILRSDLLVKIAVPSIIFAVSLAVLLLFKTFAFIRLSGWAKTTDNRIDDVLIGSASRPFTLLCVICSLYLSLSFSDMPAWLLSIGGKSFFVLSVATVVLWLSRLSADLIGLYSEKGGSRLPMTSLTRNVSSSIVYGVGILVILNSLGVSITPILTTLGVGGIAVALALQDTLSNFFSGFYIMMSRQIKVGDYIRLGAGEEGYVEDINWRVTKIRMLQNNVVIVPNSRLTQAIATNFNLPEKEMAVLLDIGVHYDSDLEKVEKITIEVARDVMKNTPGGVPDFEPFIRYHTFADFSINFSVILRAKEFVDQYLIKHEFIKKLHERYGREGIVIPYPIRAINNVQEAIAR